jgi:hypothetical protein
MFSIPFLLKKFSVGSKKVALIRPSISKSLNIFLHHPGEDCYFLFLNVGEMLKINIVYNGLLRGFLILDIIDYFERRRRDVAQKGFIFGTDICGFGASCLMPGPADS